MGTNPQPEHSSEVWRERKAEAKGYCEYADHTWVDAGGGMQVCAVCEAERFTDEWGF